MTLTETPDTELETESGTASASGTASGTETPPRPFDTSASHGDAPLSNEANVDEAPLPLLRTSLVVGCAAAAAGVMAGGLFEGVQGRVYPLLGAACGVAVAAQASRRRSAFWANATLVLGIVAVGAAFVLPAGVGNFTHVGQILSEAKGASKVLRPPVQLLPGWRLVIGLIMATIGVAAGWVGIELRRPALGLLVPLPAVAYLAISVPEAQKVPSGIVAAVLFIVGLTLLSSLQHAIDGAEQAPGLAYELKRAARALPLLAVLVGVLVVLAQTHVLFPKPRYDPARQSVAPKAVPLSKVRDRPLFTVASDLTGPWRIGILDVYTHDEWRLPAFAESDLRPVPKNGVVDEALAKQPPVQARFHIADLGGSVLPGVPSAIGVTATGPRLAYDARTGNIRLAQGQIRAGLDYTVVAAGLPTEDSLRKLALDRPAMPADVQAALDIPPPPPEVQALLAQAPTTNAWDRLDFVRRRFLENVVSAGPGSPTPVPPAKVADLVAGSKKGSPFEIVAAQAMLSRWAGVPSRIGYGYDGGVVLPNGTREVRPKHGSSWLEVWFPGAQWLPVLGQPSKATASLQPDAPTNPAAGVEASTDIAVHVYFPLHTKAASPFYAQVRRVVALAVPIGLVLALMYVTWPAAWKAWRRWRARRRARAGGIQAEIAQAYAEFRDLCTDIGIKGWSLPPLAFLDMVVDDAEHRELAWLVTRTIWGDLRHHRTEDHAADAVELARALKKRVAQAQPLTIRLIAAVSRLSIRHRFAPELSAPALTEDDVHAPAA